MAIFMLSSELSNIIFFPCQYYDLSSETMVTSLEKSAFNDVLSIPDLFVGVCHVYRLGEWVASG